MDQVNLDQVNLDQVNLDQVNLDQINLDQVIRSGHVKSSWGRSNQDMPGQFKSGLVVRQVKLEIFGAKTFSWQIFFCGINIIWTENFVGSKSFFNPKFFCPKFFFIRSVFGGQSVL